MTTAQMVEATRSRISLRTHGVYAALGAVIAFNLLFTPNFATLSNVRLQLVQVTPIVIVALGMAVVVATAGIDLSVGAIMALAAATLAATLDRGPFIAIVVALLAGALAGMFNGVLVGVVRIQPIVATLGLFIAGRGLALMIADGRLTEIFDPTIRSIGTKQLAGGFQTGVFVALGLTLIIGVLVRSTVFGKRLVAIGGSPDASRTAGLPVRRSLILVYVLSGGLAAVAGILASARSGASDPSFVGLLIELSAITAVVVGGTPLAGGEIRVMGTVAGALLMQLIFATLIRHDLSDADARMVQALIIIAAVYIQRDRLR